MTIVTIDHDCAQDDFDQQLLRYEYELAIRRLSWHCLGANNERIHFLIATQSPQEHFSVLSLAKLIFQDLLVA